jgi:glutamyl-tRNA synthetase
MGRGRLAPSPTGAQHVGNARTYLIAWLMARSQGDELRLRIEDIDSPRVKAGATALILEDLRWLGLDWDGEPIVQTPRLPLYREALQKLIDRDLVYPCTCTRSDILEAASAPHLGQDEPVYPGTCSYRHARDAETIRDRPYAWRMRVSDSPSFVDRFRGEVQINLKQHGGDFVVWKSGDSPAYQLAVVVDDMEMGITEVVRGDDLVPSTPRQLLLYRELRGNPPQFTHVPLVIGTDGRRLAKRHGDTRLVTLREKDVHPEALIGFMAWSCGWIDSPQPISSQELLPHFRLDSIPSAPFILKQEHLQVIGYVQ